MNERDAERNKLRVVQELAFEDLSWSDLHKKTHVGKNSLSKALETLRQEEAVVESLSRERGGSGRPRIMYHLQPEVRRRYPWLIEPAKEIRRIRRLVEEYSTLFFEHKRKKGGTEVSKNQVEKLLGRYLGTIMLGAIALFETELLRDHPTSASDSFLTSVHLEAIQDMLWRSEFLKKFAKETRQDMEKDLKENLRTLEQRVNQLRERRTQGH